MLLTTWKTISFPAAAAQTTSVGSSSQGDDRLLLTPIEDGKEACSPAKTPPTNFSETSSSAEDERKIIWILLSVLFLA